MMGLLNRRMNWCYVILMVSVLSSVSGSTFISDDAFGSLILGERRLLQAKTPCPVNFEFENYSIITSQCKGPDYPPRFCCSALKQFACPNAEYLNDLTNDCASTMFSYINLYGKYPPGLFSSECREGPNGLECPAQAPSVPQSENAANSSSKRLVPSSCYHLLQVLLTLIVPDSVMKLSESDPYLFLETAPEMSARFATMMIEMEPETPGSQRQSCVLQVSKDRSTEVTDLYTEKSHKLIVT